MATENQARAEGMGAEHTLPYKIALVVVVLLALAVSHALEVIIHIFRRFRRYRGVYFYSLIVASIGIVAHAFGYWIRNYDISKSVALYTVLVCGGGMMMITGQSIVLWSRLHLISSGKRDLWLLWLILADCILVQGGATVLFAGSNSTTSDRFLHIYQKWEIVQVCWFVCQECLISGIYIYRTYGLMASSAAFRGKDAKRVFTHLIIVNVIVIALDITIVAFQFAGLFYLQTSWKTLAYAIKLKLEFSILTQLVDFTKSGFSGNSGSQHASGITGRHGGARGGVQTHVSSASQFGVSTYSHVYEDREVTFSLGDVMKTTEIQIEVEEDGSSTKELRTHRERVD